MPDLSFEVREAKVLANVITPTVSLIVGISNRPATEWIQTIVLRCQAQIEAPRRRYTSNEQLRLRDLFGDPERWSDTLRPLLWSNIATTVPAFAGSAAVAIDVPCTFDFNVSATKYFHALDDGSVPVTLLFSGTVFYQSPSHQLQAVPIPWNCEARFAMPVETWKESIDLQYPNTAWLSLRRDVFERLYELKVRNGFATFDETVERMIHGAPVAGVG